MKARREWTDQQKKGVEIDRNGTVLRPVQESSWGKPRSSTAEEASASTVASRRLGPRNLSSLVDDKNERQHMTVVIGFTGL